VEICTVGSVRGESVGAAMVDLNGHEVGNGGYSQGTPTAHRHLSYSERCPVSAFYKGERQGEKLPGDWKERRGSLCVPAQVMLRGFGCFLSLQIHFVIVTTLSASDATSSVVARCQPWSI
jgi:hypothetical protein